MSASTAKVFDVKTITSVIELVSYVASSNGTETRLTSKHSILQRKTNIVNRDSHFKTMFHSIICIIHNQHDTLHS